MKPVIFETFSRVRVSSGPRKFIILSISRFSRNKFGPIFSIKNAILSLLVFIFALLNFSELHWYISPVLRFLHLTETAWLIISF